jgi:hypothetical protein
LFRALKDNVRVILFNACSTRPQAEALGEIIDCVVGMNKPIGDGAAIVFAASFYRAISFGRFIQEAFDLGKVALLLEGIPEDHTPELFVREGVDATSLRLVVPPSKSTADVLPRQSDGSPLTKGRSTMDRRTLVKILAGLTPADFELFVTTIPGAGLQISRQGTIPEKVAELIRWAESSTGPGIDAVHEAYQNFS